MRYMTQDGSGGAAEDFEGWAVEDAAVGEEAGDDSGGAGEDEREDHRDEGELEFGFKEIAGEEPCASFGENNSSQRGEHAQEEVLSEEDAVDLLARGAEGAEEDGFLDALITAGEDGGDEDNEAGDDGEQGHEPDDESNFFEDGIQGVEHEGEVDDGDVWVGADDGALHIGGLFAGVHAGGDDVETGCFLKHAGGKDDEEIWLDAFPIHLADAGDAIGHENALNVEDHFVAEIDFEVVRDAFFD